MSQKHYWEHFSNIDHKYRFWILKIIVLVADIGYLLGQTNKQPLSNLELQKHWKYNQIW